MFNVLLPLFYLATFFVTILVASAIALLVDPSNRQQEDRPAEADGHRRS